jgi:hypothetical protein
MGELAFSQQTVRAASATDPAERLHAYRKTAGRYGRRPSPAPTKKQQCFFVNKNKMFKVLFQK